MLFLTALFAVDALYAGKIKWDSSGNPIMEKAQEARKGVVQEVGLRSLEPELELVQAGSGSEGEGLIPHKRVIPI